MVDLLRVAQGMKSTNYITPRIGMTPGGLPSAGLADNSEDNLARRQAMTTNLFNTKYDEGGDGVMVRAGKFLAAAGVDMVDMVGSVAPGIERGDLWRFTREQGGQGLADFAARNQSGVELTSGLVAAVVTAGAAEAYVLPALGARLASSTMLGETKLFQAGARYFNGAKTLALDSAKSAAIAGDMATVLGTTGGRALLRARMASATAKTVGSEAAVALVTQNNQELWSDDASENLKALVFGLSLIHI